MGWGESHSISQQLNEDNNRCQPPLKRPTGDHLQHPTYRTWEKKNPLGWAHSTLEENPSVDRSPLTLNMAILHLSLFNFVNFINCSSLLG